MTSFGFSPTDVINLIQISARVYVAFKDANDNSETQVASLVHEFAGFHQLLVNLGELMTEYGKPLPIPCPDFQQMLKRCQDAIEPYKDNLVDRKMSVKKFIYTIKYIGKEKEIEHLRTQISSHCQRLLICINVLQVRLQFEAEKQTRRLLDQTSLRKVREEGQENTTEAIGISSRAEPLALPAPSEANQEYKDLQDFGRWLKSGDERIAMEEGTLHRPLSFDAVPSVATSRNDQRAGVLHHLRQELENAIMIEENRAKRTAMEKTFHLSPSETVRQEVRNLPPVPQRVYTVDSDHSDLFSGLEADPSPSLSNSIATLRPAPVRHSSSSLTPTVSLSGSPQIPASYFEPVDWGISPSLMSPSSPGPVSRRTSSISTARSAMSTSPGSHFSSGGPEASTTGTSPENAGRESRMSTASLNSITLGPGALRWNRLCHKVDVERASSHGVESKVCDVQWRYREDGGISLRSVYRSSSSKDVKTWATQQFPSTGPSVPLTTSFVDGDVGMDFPRASFGKLDKGVTDIKYTIRGTEGSAKFQTLLYTNNGKKAAELLYDRPIATINSDLHKPECRGKNVRLWKRSETYTGLNGTETADVLVLLFYTSALADSKADWVEVPHYMFQWLDSSVYKKSSEKLQLIMSKEPEKWWKEKVVSSAASVRSTRSMSSSFTAEDFNRFRYSELEIKFQKASDRKDFLELWRKYVKPL